MTADRPLVSIVTPTLNQGQFIEQTIRSIKSQTYENFEHIVIDGGSTDETLDILRRHEGTYPMRWISEPDAGMYDAINKGMRQASGDILAYLNSDDLYFPWTLKVVVQAFEQEPGADLVAGDCIRTNPADGSTYLLFQPPPFRDWVVRSGYLAQPAVFWRSRVRDEIGEFDSALRWVADCDYWMRALGSCRMGHVSEFLAVDTIQPGQFRAMEGSGMVAEIDEVRERYARLHGSLHLARHSLNRMWGAAWRRAYWLTLLARQRRGAGPTGRWGHWLKAHEPEISVREALLAQVPGLGDRYSWRAVRSRSGSDG